MDNGQQSQPQNQQSQNSLQQPHQTPPPASQQAPHPKKRLSTPVVIITVLTLLLLGTAGSLAYVLLGQKDDPKGAAITLDTDSKENTSEEALEEVAPIKDEYDGWKTFSKEGLADYQAVFANFPTVIDFRYPPNWNIIKEQIRGGVAPCAFPNGDMPAIGPKNTHHGGGSICSFQDQYGETDTIDSYAARMVSRGGGEYSAEGEINIGGIRTLVVSRTIEGQKSMIYLVDNIRQVSSTERKGSTFSCSPPSKMTSSAVEIDQFYKDCDIVLKSVKFL